MSLECMAHPLQTFLWLPWLKTAQQPCFLLRRVFDRRAWRCPQNARLYAASFARRYQRPSVSSCRRRRPARLQRRRLAVRTRRVDRACDLLASRQSASALLCIGRTFVRRYAQTLECTYNAPADVSRRLSASGATARLLTSLRTQRARSPQVTRSPPPARPLAHHAVALLRLARHPRQ